jgi:hypothetical protein
VADGASPAGGIGAIVARRAAERDEAIGRSRAYAEALASRLSLVAVVVFGSYARGDFNTWSDIDVLVVADDLPADSGARLDLLWSSRLGGIEPVAWTTEEFQARRHRRDPIATEADQLGVTVHGALPLEAG